MYLTLKKIAINIGFETVKQVKSIIKCGFFGMFIYQSSYAAYLGLKFIGFRDYALLSGELPIMLFITSGIIILSIDIMNEIATDYLYIIE
jgi:hypothetical protein